MKYLAKLLWICAGVWVGILSLHVLGVDAYAAEGSSNWRPTYDLIMRWVNFGIIIFVVYKYIRKPFMNFLLGRKEKVAEEIRKLEDQREEMTARIDQAQKDIQESDLRFEELKERIIRQGERRKQDIVASARQQSQAMLNDVQNRIKSRIMDAKTVFRAELIDAAVDFALQRLPQEITDADNAKFVDEFLTGTQAK